MPWLGSVVKKAVLNEAINIYNPDTPFNNIIEFYRFISWIANRDCEGSECVNLAASLPLPLQEVIDLILGLTDSNSDVQVLETDKQSFVILTEKLKQVYAFQPATTEEMVHRYVTENLPLLKQLEAS